MVDTSLPLGSNHYNKIVSVKPIAISATERAQFSVKGINLSQPDTRYSLCSYCSQHFSLHFVPQWLELILGSAYKIRFCYRIVCFVTFVSELYGCFLYSWIYYLRLLCAVEGKYLVQEATHELMDEKYDLKKQDELECVNFSCSIPAVTGRGFIEVVFLLLLRINPVAPILPCCYF